MTPRLRRVERVIDRAQKAVALARVTAAAAARAVHDARELLRSREQAWTAAAQRCSTGVVLASDLDQEGAHLRTLRRRADDGAQALDRAIAEEQKCASAVVKAAMEHRKLELLRDRIQAGEREEEDRKERRSSDELAARTAARSRP